MSTVTAADGATLPTQPAEEGLLVHDPDAHRPRARLAEPRPLAPGAPRSSRARCGRCPGGAIGRGSAFSRTTCCASRSATTARCATSSTRRPAVAMSSPVAATSSGPSSTNRAPTTPGTSRRTTRTRARRSAASRRSRSSRQDRCAAPCAFVAPGGTRASSRRTACWPARGGWTSPPASTGTSGRRYLQARFPLAVHSHEATYETLYGVTRRPTHRNTSWDAARYEVSGHRFADLSEPDYGVALLNDAKYGYSAHGNVLTLSLLRSPLYPDPGADEGQHRLHLQPFPASGRLDRGRTSSAKRSRSTRR